MRSPTRNVQVVPSRESSAQRGLARRTVILAVLTGAGAVLAAGLWPKSLPAGEEAQRIAALQALCEEDQSGGRGALALRKIAAVGGKDAVKALETLADWKDERVAAQALAEIARAGYSGGDTKLKKVLEDSARSDAARSFALTAWCHSEHTAGRSWDDEKAYLESQSTNVSALVDAAKAAKKSLWGKE